MASRTWLRRLAFVLALTLSLIFCAAAVMAA
jgi:hypothetical protein